MSWPESTASRSFEALVRKVQVHHGAQTMNVHMRTPAILAMAENVSQVSAGVCETAGAPRKDVTSAAAAVRVVDRVRRLSRTPC